METQQTPESREEDIQDTLSDNQDMERIAAAR